MNEVTRILSAVEHGDPHAAEQLLPLVYEELRKVAAYKLAHEQPGQTLQATALVHEAYLRLMGDDPIQPWEGRAHFFAAAGRQHYRTAHLLIGFLDVHTKIDRYVNRLVEFGSGVFRSGRRNPGVAEKVARFSAITRVHRSGGSGPNCAANAS